MAPEICLALNMYFEARDQGIDGMMMVADVTITRTLDDRYPDTVCGVVWQRKQFSWTHDGMTDSPDTSTYHDREAWALARDLAAGVMEDDTVLPRTGATHYHADHVSPGWADTLTKVGMVGDHIFYVWE